MQSSEQTTEEAEDATEGPAPYRCILVAQLHAREKKSVRKRKRPAHGLLGKRTNAILDKYGLRRIIPSIELMETECKDDKYDHYTTVITFETDAYSDDLMAALNEVRSMLVWATRPRFFKTNNVLEASFDMKQGAPDLVETLG